MCVVYIYIYIIYIYIYIYIYRLHQTQPDEFKKQIKTPSKEPVDDIVVLSAGTIFVIRQKLA